MPPQGRSTAEEDRELETRADYKYCPQCLAAVPADAADCVHCGWRPGTPAFPDLNRTLVIPAWSQDNLRLLEAGVRPEAAPINEAASPDSVPDAQWLVRPESKTAEAPTEDAPAMASEAIADVPSAQMSADELNLLTEPLLEEEPQLRSPGKSQMPRIIQRTLGALMVAAALVILLRQIDDLRYGTMWRIAGVVLAIAGLVLALLPSLWGRRPQGKPPRR